MPASVRDAVFGRAAGLGDGARAALEAAAVVPDRVELDLLYAVSGASTADLEECERADLLEIGTAASRRTATSSHATPSSTASPPYAAGSCTPPSSPTCSPAPATTSRGSPTTPTWPATRPRSLTHAVDRRRAGRAARLPPRGRCPDGPGAAPTSTPQTATGRPTILGRAPSLPGHRAARRRRHGRLDRPSRSGGARRRDLAAQLATLRPLLWILARGDESRAAIGRGRPAGHGPPRLGRRGAGLGTASSLYDARPRDPPLARDRSPGHRARPRTSATARVLARALNAVGSGHWFARPTRREPLAGGVDGDGPSGCRRLRRGRGALVNLGSGAGEVRRYDVARRWLEEARRVLRRARPRPQPRLRHQLACPDRARAGRWDRADRAGPSRPARAPIRSRASAR